MKKIIGLAAPARSGKDTVAELLLEHAGVEAYALADPLKTACQALFGLTKEQAWSDDLKEKQIEQWQCSPRAFFQMVGTEWMRHYQADHWLKRAQLAFENQQTLSMPPLSDDQKKDDLLPIKLATQAIFGLSSLDKFNKCQIEHPHAFWKISPKQMLNLIQTHVLSVYPNYFELRRQNPIAIPFSKEHAIDAASVVIIKDIRFENEAEFIRQQGGTVWHIQRDDAQKVKAHSSESGVKIHSTDKVILNNAGLDELKVSVNTLWGRI